MHNYSDIIYLGYQVRGKERELVYIGSPNEGTERVITCLGENGTGTFEIEKRYTNAGHLPTGCDPEKHIMEYTEEHDYVTYIYGDERFNLFHDQLEDFLTDISEAYKKHVKAKGGHCD